MSGLLVPAEESTVAPAPAAPGAPDGGEGGGGAPCTFVKRKRRNKNGRKRAAAEPTGEGEENVVKRRATAKRGVQASTARARPAEDDVMVAYKSTRSAKPEGPDDGGATATLEIDTDYTRDAQSIFERAQEARGEIEAAAGDDKVYRGLAAYEMLQRKETTLGNAFKGLTQKGPIRAPLNLRSTVRWDYAPDICKDYKETGYCGYGDSCKFLHDRSDYKSGWEIDREIEAGTYKEADAKAFELEGSDSDSEDDLPFACFICREDFTLDSHPVVTTCGHYFREKCLLKWFRKHSKCPTCGLKTGNTFKPAHDLIAKLKEKERLTKQAEEEGAGGEGEGGGNDGQDDDSGDEGAS